MIDKYLLDDFCQRNDEKGELARWVLECQAEVDRERRKSAALEREIYRLQGIVNTPVKLPPLLPDNPVSPPSPSAIAHNNAITACAVAIRGAGFKSEATISEDEAQLFDGAMARWPI